jgi:hypothetical protein
MSLAENEVHGFRLLDLNDLEFGFHSGQMVARRRCPVKPGTMLFNESFQTGSQELLCREA